MSGGAGPDGKPGEVLARSAGGSDRIVAELGGEGPGKDPFAAAVCATRLPMIVTNPRLSDNPVVFANDAFCRLTGYDMAEILNRNCRFLQGRNTCPLSVARIREAVRDALPIEIELRNYRKTGEAFWNRLLLEPVPGEGGEVAYFFAYLVDVTVERARLEGLETHNAALMAEVAGRLGAQQESEARLRFATDAGRLGIWELDLLTEELTASPRFKRNFGYDPEEPFSLRNLEDAVHPDDRRGRSEAFELSRATGNQYQVGYRIIRPGGEIRWLEVAAQVAQAPDGTPLRMAGISMDVTERRRAELSLHLSRESLRLATGAAEIGTWDLDIRTDTLTWCDRTKEMFGISPGVLCSMKDFYEGLHTDDRESTAAAFASALDPAVRATYDVEYRTVGKEDGIIRWVAAKGKGVFDGSGRCIRALGTAIDITARKQATVRQTFVFELTDRFRAMTDPKEIMGAAVRSLGHHLMASRAGYGMVQEDDRHILLETGFTDAAQPLSGIFSLDDFGARNIALQRQGVTVVCPDTANDEASDPDTWKAIGVGSFVSVPLVRGGRFRASMFVNRPGPYGWPREEVLLVEDIAARTWEAVERARAEAALRKANEELENLVVERTAVLRANEARLRTIFETSNQLQGLLTPDGIIMDANAASLAAIEAALADVVGKPFWEAPWFTATLGMPETVRRSVLAAADGKEIRLEIAVLVASGLRSYDFSLRPVRDAEGRVVAIVPEAMDITERRQTEEALRQAQKMEAVGQLTGGIAHDFNNLLTGITGSLELVNRRIEAGRTEGLARFTSAAITAAQRAAALTQRLLAFARRQPLEPRRVEANRLVADMEDLLRRTLGPAIQLDLILPDDLWPTVCDPNQLESALLNLAINSRDAMPEGGRLAIETSNSHLDDAYVRSHASDTAAGQYVTVSVTDTGGGIPPDIIGKVFDPFFTTKPLGQGTGLGLSMLYGFVKQSGGHARIHSEIGRGTTVKLYLPRYRAAELPDGPDPAPDVRPDVQATDGEVILVVDDEATVRLLVVETLTELGYTALEAADGPAALRILQSDGRIDLLVTDVGLPGLNGRQVADAGRIARPGMRVLFMTGYVHNAFLSDGAALEPGMEMITKPFALDALAAKMRGMLEAGR